MIDIGHSFYNVFINLLFLGAVWQIHRFRKTSLYPYFRNFYVAILLFHVTDSYFTSADIFSIDTILFLIVYMLMTRVMLQSFLTSNPNFRSIYRINDVVFILMILLVVIREVFDMFDSIYINNIFIIYTIFFILVCAVLLTIDYNHFVLVFIVLGVVGTTLLLVDFVDDLIEFFNMILFVASINIFSIFIYLMKANIQTQFTQIETKMSNQENVLKFIAHDLKAPLVSINAYNTEIRTEDKANKYANQTLKIGQNIALINNLIDKFVSLAKLKSNSLNMEWNDLDLLVKTIVYSNSQLFERVDYQIEYKLESMKIYCDKFYFGRILKNLIENSVKYRSEKRRLQIDIQLKSGSDYSEFIYRDNGIGIESQDLPKIFDPHYRAYKKKDIEGSGYGLAIVKFTIEKHTWQIQVNSEVDKFTEFVIRIPNSHVKTNTE